MKINFEKFSILISLVGANKTSLTLPLFIEVSVPIQESGWSCTFARNYYDSGTFRISFYYHF